MPIRIHLRLVLADCLRTYNDCFAFYNNPASHFSILNILENFNTVCGFRLELRFGNLNWNNTLVWLF